MLHSHTEHNVVVSDPLTSGGSSSVHSVPQYLPEYLLGDPTSVATSPIHTHRLWTSHLGDSNSPYKNSHTPYPSNADSQFSNAAAAVGQASMSTPSSKLGRSMIGEKQSGPPIQGLFSQNQGSSPMNSSFTVAPSKLSTTIGSITLGTAKDSNPASLNNSVLSPAQLDPFYTQGEDLRADENLDETWVTVFGFPSSAVSYILQQFSQYGNILEHKISGSNNWVHIHYQSKIQAKKALGKNGKIFAGNMMIGVQPCIDKHVMSDSIKENLSVTSPLYFSPTYDAGSGERSTAGKVTGIRPLTQAYRTAASNHEVVPSSRTPQKKNSVVTKAMEYVFGW